MSYEPKTLKLAFRHSPDFSLDPDPDGNKVRTELPGTYEIGVEVDGHFVVIHRGKAGKLLSRVAAAKTPEK